MPDAPTTDAPAEDDVDDDDHAPAEQAKGKETDWKAESRKWQDRAKTNRDAAKELDELRKRTETDQEKAVRAAREEARTETLREVGVARAEDAIRFSVGDRLPEKELDELLEDLNLARFLTDDGNVDRKKVGAYVKRITPEGKAPVIDLGQGARGTGKPGGDMNSLIRNRMRR